MTGVSVHPGRQSGRAVPIAFRDPVRATPSGQPVILIFPQARPNALEYFEGVAALVFAERGILSHACTIAHEQGIPTVTALGKGALRTLRENPGCWITVEGTTGKVIITV